MSCQLRHNERFFAFLDDTHLTTNPDTMSAGCTIVGRKTPSPCGFARQPESPNVHISGPSASNTVQREDTQEEEERKKEKCGGKSQFLGGPGEGSLEEGQGGLGERRFLIKNTIV